MKVKEEKKRSSAVRLEILDSLEVFFRIFATRQNTFTQKDAHTYLALAHLHTQRATAVMTISNKIARRKYKNNSYLV